MTNRYNECGYRSPTSCGPKQPGSLRVAILGSSTAEGWLVDERYALSGRIRAWLSDKCRLPVDTQNLAMEGMPVGGFAASARDAMKLAPDALVLPVTSYDLETAAVRPASNRRMVRAALDSFNDALGSLALFHMARALVLSRESQFIAHARSHHRESASMSPDMREGLAQLTAQVRQIRTSASDPKVPLILIFAPSRMEVVEHQLYPKQADPLRAALARIARVNGAEFVDARDDFPAAIPTSDLFYVVSYHLNGAGQRYLADAALEGLRRSVPGFARCVKP